MAADQREAAAVVVITARARLLAQALARLLTERFGMSAIAVTPEEAAVGGGMVAVSVVALGADVGPAALPGLARAIQEGNDPPALLLLEMRPGQRDERLVSLTGAAGWVGAEADGAALARAIAEACAGGRVSQAPAGSRVPGTERARGAASGGLDSLTDREMEVLALLSGGHSPDGVAARLQISRHTVRTHIQNMMGKLLVGSRAELVAVARRSGVTPQRTVDQSR